MPILHPVNMRLLTVFSSHVLVAFLTLSSFLCFPLGARGQETLLLSDNPFEALEPGDTEICFRQSSIFGEKPETIKNLSFNWFDSKVAALLPTDNKPIYWLKITIKNPFDRTEERLLAPGDWAGVKLYVFNEQGFLQDEAQTGRMLTLKERSIQKNKQLLPIQWEAGQTLTLYLGIEESMSFYAKQSLRLALSQPAFQEKEDGNRFLFQGIFLGIIFVLAAYNLLIYLSVRDISFLYYVISLICVGLYFMFYYGFTLEWFWGNTPRWNAYSFALIVPLSRVSWIFFTKSYLQVPQILPRWTSILNFLALVYASPILLGLYSYFNGHDLSYLTVNLIGIMGIMVLSLMLWVGALALRKGYKAARYFLIANVIFSIGSILFIFRETGYLPDTVLTRYSAQIGIVIQGVLFSLGLAYRLNEARQEIAQKELEKISLEKQKEIEKQALIFKQKEDLERQVKERTADLEHKAQELEAAFLQLKHSEEDLRGLNHLKDKLFSVISHDLRSPLATLNSFLNILTNFPEALGPEEHQKLAQTTQRALKNLSDLLDNLLQWATLQMDSVRFNPQNLKLHELVQSNIQLLKETAEIKKIQLSNEVDENLRVFGDPHMVAFIIRNLLFNAVKFTAESGMIKIEAKREAEQIFVSIQDNGVGMTEATLQKLFNKKTPLSTLGTQNEKGLGLGLLLCKEFVEKHGGKLSVKSRRQQGSTFSFTLPLHESVLI